MHAKTRITDYPFSVRHIGRTENTECDLPPSMQVLCYGHKHVNEANRKSILYNST